MEKVCEMNKVLKERFKKFKDNQKKKVFEVMSVCRVHRAEKLRMAETQCNGLMVSASFRKVGDSWFEFRKCS